MFNNILLATDLAETSSFVAQRARDIADKFNAKLSVVYVLEYAPIVYGEGEFSIPIDADLMSIFEKNIRKALSQFGKDFDIPPEQQYLEVGYVKGAIINLAEKLQTDLIIIGSHGKHGMQLLLGSTANAIVHAAKCNVMAVRVGK